MPSTVVIGANFGDEGKGLITDFEVRRTGAEYVARFNGGAQAGHTVHSEGRRHVFGHVGAGSFAGAHTYLGSKFIVNPFLLSRELDQLRKLGLNPTVSAHDNARVTTIYDVALNTMVEISRGSKRHGSCGVGINETVTRHERHPLTIYDLLSKTRDEIADILEQIHTEYIPQRMAELGIDPATKHDLMDDDYFSQAGALMYADNMLFSPPRKPNGVVFEGAQGLALDEFMGKFPHVTRSMTGLPYAIIAASELGIKKLQPVYVTRSYLTRHGAGPLEHEGVEFGGYQVQDKTNVDNPWQGTLRYAPLNLPMMAHFLHEDAIRAEYIAQAHGVELVQPTLAITCLDQLHGDVTIFDLDGQFKTLRTSYLPRYLSQRLHIRVSHISHGPDFSDVQFLGTT